VIQANAIDQAAKRRVVGYLCAREHARLRGLVGLFRGRDFFTMRASPFLLTSISLQLGAHLPHGLKSDFPLHFVAMDFVESEDEEVDLPIHLESPTESIDENANSDPSLRSSVLTDRTKSRENPQSPGLIGTQTLDQIYERSRITRAASTTPLKSPPKSSFPAAVPTNSVTEPQPVSVRVSFKDVQMIKPQPESDPMSVTPSESNPFRNEQQPRTGSFIERVAAYQKSLDEQYKEFETSLKDRDRSQELASLDWEDLEERYQKEIAPKLADEEQIMEDFELRFNVTPQPSSFW
jgi:hypothetical protein